MACKSIATKDTELLDGPSVYKKIENTEGKTELKTFPVDGIFSLLYVCDSLCRPSENGSYIFCASNTLLQVGDSNGTASDVLIFSHMVATIMVYPSLCMCVWVCVHLSVTERQSVN